MKTVIFLISIFLWLSVQAQTQYPIPPQAFNYKETIKEEINTYFPELATINYIPALIEHESCLSLRHSRCWSPTARRFIPGREEGVGLGQITRTWRSNGLIRFDTLNSLRNEYPEALHELSWDNVQQRPDLQIRAIVLLVRSEYERLWDIEDSFIRLQMANAAYNGGPSMLKRERQVCHLAAGCDATVWFDNVEDFCVRSQTRRNNERSPCEINRHHVDDVFNFRLPRYQLAYFINEEIDIAIEDPGEDLVDEATSADTPPSNEPVDSTPKKENNGYKFCIFSWCFY